MSRDVILACDGKSSHVERKPSSTVVMVSFVWTSSLLSWIFEESAAHVVLPISWTVLYPADHW